MTSQALPAAPATRLALAARDVNEGVAGLAVWSTLGWLDIRQRYRRSVLGPLWITLTTLITIAGMGPLYGALLRIPVEDFVPYLALGIIVWSLISSLIIEGCACFIGAETMIRSVRLPLTLHVLRTIYRNLLMFAHNALAFVPIMALFGILPRWSWLAALPGVLLVLLAAYPTAIVLSIFCTRFRDMQPIVTSFVQLAFFLTPILWKPEALGERRYLAEYNPLYVFVEVIRAPIYEGVPDAALYAKAAGLILALYLLAIPLFVRYRARVPFWL